MTSAQSVGGPVEVSAGIARRAAQIGISILLLMAVLLLSAGKLNWLWAWVYLGIYLAGIAINSVFMLRSGRETVAERSRMTGMKAWDKAVGWLWALCFYLALPLTAGLDERLRWTGDLSLGVHLAGAGLFVAGFGLFSWAMISNAFFSTVARIQSERGQTVCRSGPYRFVRHPGYAGAILQAFGVPLLLGSYWALIAGALAAAFMVARTAFEDRMLQAGLPGYREYTQEVRYRLAPGIW